MLSRAQQVLIKRAQRQAALADDEYREALQTVSGCRSTRDARMTDRHVDLALAYFEAIYWRKVDLGAVQPDCNGNSVFAERGYWANKNPRQETSRDRFAASSIAREIGELERELAALGLGAAYCASIRVTVIADRVDVHSLHKYRAALERTLKSKRKILAGTPAETIRI